MIYSTKKLKEAKKKQKQDQQQSQEQTQKQKQSGKAALKLNGNEKHAISDVSLRRLKTSYSNRLSTYYEISQVPSLHLMGNWLRKAGFEIGDYATLVVSKGLIVIRKEENNPED